SIVEAALAYPLRVSHVQVASANKNRTAASPVPSRGASGTGLARLGGGPETRQSYEDDDEETAGMVDGPADRRHIFHATVAGATASLASYHRRETSTQRPQSGGGCPQCRRHPGC